MITEETDAVVISTPRLSTVKIADRVYVLDENRVIGESSYHEFFHFENRKSREMVEMQSLQFPVKDTPHI